MKIAIKFNDNDFSNCFTGVLKTMLNGYRWNDNRLPTDKELLCKIINELSYGCYLLFQNQFEYNEEKDGVLCKRTKDYLTVKNKDILINEEVDLYLKENEWGNCETFILDTDLDYTGNNAVYSH